MKLFSSCLYLLTICFSLYSQTDTAQNSCTSTESKQFDFWLGEWNLTWNDTLHGTNIITKVLGDCVIHENFSDPAGKFYGQSFSVYDPDKKQWQQTWVDNAGNYMMFVGEFKDEKMLLSRSFIGNKGNKVTQRMVFYNITPGSFEWSWESSIDEGKTWKQNWLIYYQRKPKN